MSSGTSDSGPNSRVHLLELVETVVAGTAIVRTALPITTTAPTLVLLFATVKNTV